MVTQKRQRGSQPNASASRRSSKAASASPIAATGIPRSLSRKRGRATHSRDKMISRRNGKDQRRRRGRIKRERRAKIRRRQRRRQKRPRRRRTGRSTTTTSTRSRSCAASSGWVASIRTRRKRIFRFGGRAQRRRS